MSIDEKYLLVCMMKGLVEDKQYATAITTVFEEQYFDDAHTAEMFKYIKSHLAEYKSLPSRDIIINSVPNEVKDSVVTMFQEMESTDFSVSKNYDFLYEQSNIILKDKAIKRAIVESVDMIDGGDNVNQIRSIIEAALCKDMKIDIGLDYFQDLSERLKRVFSATDNRIKTYYPTLDEMFNGGYPPYTLNMMIAATHGHKSSMIINLAKRQVNNCHKVAIATLEMSQDAYSQRFDSNFTGLDINRIYINKTIRGNFIKDIKEIKDSMGEGALYIKEYPTGKATVNDFRIWLRELAMRDRMVDILYCDYIGLMKPEGKNKGDLYQDNKTISEELRALGMEFNIPVVTVSQVNRSGTFLDFESLDSNSIADSFGIAATVDSMIVMGKDEDDMVYQNEIRWKMIKNRLGGRCGDISKFYHDAKSLRIYDEQEIDLWVKDANKSKDDRKVHEGRS
jgi:hypothetical protein